MRIPINAIRSEVFNHFGASVETNGKRHRQYLTVRQMFVYVAREYGYSLNEIGVHIGKNHASVINNWRRACEYMQTDRHFREQLEVVMDLVRNLPAAKETKIEQAKREIQLLEERIKELGGEV